MKEAVVLFTGPLASHLLPIVSLAKLLLKHGFLATVVTYNYPLRPGMAEKDILNLSPANSEIAFHVLPSVSLGDSYLHAEPAVVSRATLNAQKQNLHDFIVDLSKTSSVQAVMVDFFCMVAVEVAKELSIPAYVFSAASASAVAFFLNMLELNTSSNHSLNDFGKNPINFPGLPPLPASEFPIFLHDRESNSYKSLMHNFPNLVKSDGILMNTFESLEPKAISALREGLCVPSFKMPPVYTISPLVNKSRVKETGEQHECLKWLDLQPKGSVVFLCFGSLGGFVPDQIRQIAIGLENSGQRFLWVVKVINDPTKFFGASIPEFELDQVLPEGFLERTKDKSMVVKTWAPQIHVLHHESVGGFVTHCGWNSILEAVTAGKPMICWPLYAEQRLNKALLVDHGMRLGVAIEGYDQNMVEAEEVEAKVRWLMEAEGGKLLKERTNAMKLEAAEALSEAGSSSKAFLQFLTDSERQRLAETKV
jgi:hypothetical protein